MNRSIIILTLAFMLLLIGWAVGKAQTATPDFELIVNAPGGETTIECVRGCDLKWVQRGVTTGAAMPKFTFSCGASECSSGRIGGWLRR